MFNVMDKTLEEFLEPLPKPAQKFLLARLQGFDIGTALKFASVNRNSASLWRARNPYFKELEQYLMARVGEFRVEAEGLQRRRLDRLVILALTKLIDMGNERWDDLDNADKRYVMRALSIMGNLKKRGKVAPKETEGYEEMLLRLRKNKEASK